VIASQRGLGRVLSAFTDGTVLHRLHPMHLWFLEYLLLLYVAAAGGVFLARGLPEGVRRRVTRAYRWGLERWYAPVLCALLSWLPLSAMGGQLKDPEGFMPEPVILLAYVVPFGIGWLLYPSRDLLPRFRRHVGLYVALTVPAWFVWVASRPAHPLLTAAGNTCLCWFWTFAWVGLFMKLLSRPHPLARYLSDSSYWLYIMHLPVVVGLQFAMLPVPWSAMAKIPVVLALALAILLASYDLVVRPTWVGVLLNGRRYPRQLGSLLGFGRRVVRRPAEL
jgi:peptidoglycan/LPS O-acetylase OafA/YrhL